MHINKTMTNMFGLHNQPCKNTRPWLDLKNDACVRLRGDQKEPLDPPHVYFFVTKSEIQ